MIDYYLAPRAQDPTLEEMRAFLIAQFGSEADDFDREGAIYAFATDWHSGITSNLYAALCASEFKPGMGWRGVEPDTMEQLCYQALEEEYSK